MIFIENFPILLKAHLHGSCTIQIHTIRNEAIMRASGM